MSRPYRPLINVNRCLILLFVILGQLSDGLQTGDYFFFVATVLWVWLPSCVRLEAIVINFVTHHEHTYQPNKKNVTRTHRVAKMT